MKRIITSLLAVFAVLMNVNAQLTEGHVSYNVEFSSKQPEFQMYAGMMQGSRLDIYFTKGKSRTEMKVGTIMETVNIIENASEKMLTLMSGMIGKKAIEGTTKKEETKEPAPKFDVELVNETKEIAGYKCKKAIVTDEQSSKYNFWYTEDIKMNSKGQKYFDEYGIPGFPMEMEFIQNDMNVRMVASSIEKLPKKNNLFSLDIPEGYQLTTQKELEEIMGGMK